MKRQALNFYSLRQRDFIERRRRLAFELLEGRRVLAQVHWTGAAGTFDWGTAGNWSTNAIPGGSDDVTIGDLPGDATITYGSGNQWVRSLVTLERVHVTGGTLTVGTSTVDLDILAGSGSVEVGGGTLALAGTNWENASTLVLASGTLNLGGSFIQPSLGTFVRSGGTVNLNGTLDGDLTLNASTGSWRFGGSGTLRNSTLTVDPSVEFRSADFFTFDNVTIATGSAVRVASNQFGLTIVNGLTLDGRLLLGDTSAYGKIDSNLSTGNASQTISGTGRIEFNHEANVINSSFNSQSGATGGTLVIGPGITLAGYGASATNERIQLNGNGSIVLQGTLEVDGTTASVDILLLGTNANFVNEGSIRSTDATLNIRSTSFVNSTAGEVITTGGSFLVGGHATEGRTWTNQGLIEVTDTTVSLGGNFTQYGMGIAVPVAGQGTFERVGGTVTLVGNLTGPLALTPDTGTWRFGGTGRLKDSTLTVHPSVDFQSSGSFTFDNVTIPAGSTVKVASGTLHLIIDNGMTLDGRLLLGDANDHGRLLSNRVSGNGSQIIGGTGRIEFNHQVNVITSNFNSPATGGTLVFGPGITLAGQDPAATNERIRFVGNGSFELQGTVEVDGATSSIDIEPIGTVASFNNAGTIRSTAGTLNIRPTSFINSADGEVVTTGGSFLVGGDATQGRTWTNQGLIEVIGTTVSLGGNFTQAGLGVLQRDPSQPGIVTLVGNLTGPLTLDGDTGTWWFGGTGRLKDSTLTVHPSVDFQSSGIFTFDNVTISAGSAVKVTSGTLHLAIANGMTLNGRLLLGDATVPGRILSSSLSGNGSQSINGTGRIEFNHQSNVILSNFSSPATGGTLVIGPGITLAGQDPLATNERIRFEGNASVLNQGTLVVDGSSATAEVVVNRFENQGYLRAINAAVIDIRPTTFVNFTDVTNLGNNRFGVTLQEGTFEANDGTIRLFQGTNTAHSFVVKKLETELILVGTTPRIYGHTTNTASAIAELAEIGTVGTLRLRDGVFYEPAGEILVQGQVDVDATSRFGLAPLAPITTVGLESHFEANGDYGNSAVGADAVVATPMNGSGFTGGIDGQGFSFDGVNDHITIPAVSALNNPNLTVAAWYKLDQLQTGYRVLFGKTIGNGTLNSYSVWLNGDSINYGIGHGGGFDWRGVPFARRTGQWNHVALAFDDASNLVQLYLNGSLLDSFTSTLSISYDDNRPHVLGADIESGNPAYFFPGVIDEVRHYDRALSASEIFDIAADSPAVATIIRQVAGEVRVGGSLASLGQYHLEGGTLFGVGTLPINLNHTGGVLAPGNSPGCLEVDGDYNLAVGGTLQIEIDGPTVCSQYDQLQVNGTVTLAGTLDVVLDPTYNPVVGEKFLVLENDEVDPIAGQFLFAGDGLRERQVFIVNGNQLFRISYSGGDGNDVELEFLGKGALVSNTSDSGAGSLRQAVEDANLSPGHDLIAFAIDDALQVNGRYLIESAGLNVSSAMITIDGTTQYDFINAPIVELRDELGDSATGITLTFEATNSVVRGLAITGWTTGIGIGAENVRIAGNYVGIALDDSTGGGNGIGIVIAPSLDSQVLIGGTTSDDRNVIANSQVAGIEMFSVSNAVVQGNYIGTDPSGLIARPNQRGIYIWRQIAQAADNNLIGGPEPGEGNLISGNTIAGIEIDANGNFMEGNQIVGNWIGVDATGNAALPNGMGVVLANSFGTSVSQNVISGNNTHGILITAANENTLTGNIIGLNVAGDTAVPNLNHGVSIGNFSENNIVGGIDAASRNVISGNNGYGVSISSSNNNRILGNYLGTDTAGESELTNGLLAIGLNESSFNSIGSNEGNFNGNLIVGASASQNGISIENQSNFNSITANRFGLSATDQPLGYLGNAVSIQTANDNTIGGSALGERNIIGRYASHGIVIANGAETNTVIGNYVGVHPDGQSAIFTEQHSTYGIAVLNASNNLIGLGASGTENLIGGNQFGIYVAGTAAIGNSIDGNHIGLTSDGLSVIPNEIGILIADARNTSVGVVRPNIVSGNRIGIEVSTVATQDTIIANNWIGTNGIVGSNDIGSTLPGEALGNGESAIRHVSGVRTLISGNTIVASGVLGPLLPPDPPGAVEILGGDAVLSGNSIFNNFVDSIRTAAFPGTITITQARLDGFALGEVVGATPFTTFTVEFFESSEQEQAERFIGNGFIVTDENGYADFEIGDLGDLTPGKYLTATITGALTDGGSNLNTSAIAAGAIPQVALIRGLPTRSPEGKPINLEAFAVDSTISGYAITGYLWEVEEAGQIYASGNEPSIQFSPDDEGVYTVRLILTLTDNTGDQQTVVLGPHEIAVFNVAPTPQFDIEPSLAQIGQVVTLRSNSTDPGREDLLEHTWQVRYGSPTGSLVFAAGPSFTEDLVSFTPTAGGNYFITLTVDDLDGGTTGARSLTRLLQVSGAPSSTAILVPLAGSEGQTIRARAPETELQRAEELVFAWQVFKNDVVYTEVEIPAAGVIEFTPDDDGIYRVELSITDGNVTIVAPSQEVTVTNASPVVSVRGPDGIVAVNTPLSFEADLFDPGAADSHIVDWVVERNGAFVTSGSSSSAPWTFPFTPNQGGVYKIIATANDDDFDPATGVGRSTSQKVFYVSESGQGLMITDPATPPGGFVEGDEIEFSAVLPALPSGVTVNSYQWSAVDVLGRSLQPESGLGPDVSAYRFTPPSGGEFLVFLNVLFSDGRSLQAISAPLAVLGLAPVISSMSIFSHASNQQIGEGDLVQIRTTAFDAAERIGLEYVWELKRPGQDWIEVRGQASEPSVLHFIPRDDGLHEVRVTVRDSEGLSVSQELTRFGNPGITVQNLLTSVDLSLTSYTANDVTFSANAIDPGSDDQGILTYSWSINGGSFSTPDPSDVLTTSLNGLTTLALRVYDDSAVPIEVAFYLLVGTVGDDIEDITQADELAAVTSGADRIVYLGLDGNDQITVLAGIDLPIVVFGGDGNDILNASSATGKITLDGGEGDDTLRGGAGENLLKTGPGANVTYGGSGYTLHLGGGDDWMYGGSGADDFYVHFSEVNIVDTAGGLNTVNLQGSSQGVTLNFGLTDGTAQTVFPGSTLSLEGTFQRLVGSPFPDHLTTDKPGTTLFGGEGNDTLIANTADVVLDGGAGNNQLVLSNASGTFRGGIGANTILGTLAANTSSIIELGDGNGALDIAGALPADGELFAEVSISGGEGTNTIAVQRVRGKVYAYQGAVAGEISEFGSARFAATSTITVGNSSDIDIFGSARPGNTFVVTQSQDIDIFGGGGDTAVLTAVEGAVLVGSLFGQAVEPLAFVSTINASSDIDIFGSARPQTALASTINNSSDIDIFGCARSSSQITVRGSDNIDIFGVAEGAVTFTSDDLGAASSNGSVTISAFGSAVPRALLLSLTTAQDIDIFGSAASNGTPLNATVHASNDISIFGSGARNTSLVVTASQDIDIFGILDGDIRLGPESILNPGDGVLNAVIEASGFGSAVEGGQLNLFVNNAEHIDIFGGVAQTAARLNATILNSSDIDIFGSARGGTIQTSFTQDIDIFGQGSESISLDEVTGAAVFTQVFGTAAPQNALQLSVAGQSSDIDIFGSGNRNANIIVFDSSDIDIFGGTAITEYEGVTLVGDTVTLTNVENARVASGIFGSAVPDGRVMNLSITGNSSDIDIFGTARGRSLVTVTQSQDIDIFGGYGDEVILEDVEQVRIEGGIFGTANPAILGLTATVSGNSQDIDIFGTTTHDDVSIDGGTGFRIALRDGDDQLTIANATNVLAVFDQGDDQVTVESGNDMLLYLAAGDDRASVKGGENIRVIGGDGADQFSIAGGHQIDIDGGSGDDLVVLVEASSPIIRMDEGNDSLRMFGGIGALTAAGAGNDSLIVYGRLGSTLAGGQVYALIDGQSGDDHLEVRPLYALDDPARTVSLDPDPLDGIPAWMELPSTIASPSTTTFTSSVALIGGAGNDVLRLHGNQRLLALGGTGDDELHLIGGSNSTLAGGDGSDQFFVSAAGVGNYVFGGNDNDAVTVIQGTGVGVFTESGDDHVVFTTNGEEVPTQSFARGGLGNDRFTIEAGRHILVAGEVGSNHIEVTGGHHIVAAGGIANDRLVVYGGSSVVLLGEGGHDLLEYHGGEDVILSGGDGDDQLLAYGYNIDLYGDDGDDVYQLFAASEPGEVLIRELLFIDGENFEAEARGADTIDLSAFTEGVTLDLTQVGLLQSLFGDHLSLHLQGSLENIVGTQGDDVLYGNDEANRLDGGGGDDQLFGFGGDDILISRAGNDQLHGGYGNDHYVFASPEMGQHVSVTVIEAPGDGKDQLDFSALTTGLGSFSLLENTPQEIAGETITLTLRDSLAGAASVAEIEDLIGTHFDDMVIGNGLDNRIELLGGINTVDGKGGNDIYVFAGGELGELIVHDRADYSGTRTLDFAAFDAPLLLDLELAEFQNFADQLRLRLVEPLAIHNVVGTSFDDHILGNANDNVIYGAAGRDVLEGRGGSDRLVADLPQVVLLDFDSAFRAERGDYEYSAEQRQEILNLVAMRFSQFNWQFTLDETEAAEWTNASGRTYVRLNFSEGRGGGVSGDAGEIDFRNVNRGLVSQVNINSLKGSLPALLAEQLERDPTESEIDEAIVKLSAHIAAHELGHTAGLRHADALGPIGSGFFAGADLSRVYPPYSGPLEAVDTGKHLIASPASLGTTIVDALGDTFFGAREAIKLAFNEIGVTRREVNRDFGSHASLDSDAEDLGSLAPLYVPNLAPLAGHTYSDKVFEVNALAIVGNLAHELVNGQRTTERDVYRFTGKAGEWVNIEVIANGVRPLRGSLFDGQVKIFTSNGELLGWNDDEFEGTKDAVLFDVLLPADGEYFVEVSLSDFPAIDAPGDRYELFISRFRALPAGSSLPPVPGDVLIGGDGADELFGGAADDQFIATTGGGIDMIFGRGGADALEIGGLDYEFDPQMLDSVEVIANENIAPVATLVGIPSGPLEPATSFEVSLIEALDPSINDTNAGFRYAFALLLENGTLHVGELPITWQDAVTGNSRAFTVQQPGTYTLVARVFDVRNAYRDYQAEVIISGPANEPPVDILIDADTIHENMVTGTTIGRLQSVDPTDNDEHSYLLVSGAGSEDNTLFEIVGDELRALQSFDYEMRSSYSVRIRTTDLAGNAFEKEIEITVLNVPELASPIVIGDGTQQRSLVKSVRLTFDQSVEFVGPPVNAFEVVHRESQQIVVLESHVGHDAQGHTVVTLYFSGAMTRNGALKDGNYQLRIRGASVVGWQGDDYLFGTQTLDRFYAYFADVDGDRTVTLAEFNLFRSTFGKFSSDSGYDPRFDFEGIVNGIGGIGISDFGQFRARFGQTLPWQ
jgi:parallel beta-helix repeat protein